MDAIYAKEDFSDADGDRVGVLQIEFEEMNGWNAESDAATLLSHLDIPENLHYSLMADLDGKQKSPCSFSTSPLWRSGCTHHG